MAVSMHFFFYHNKFLGHSGQSVKKLCRKSLEQINWLDLRGSFCGVANRIAALFDVTRGLQAIIRGGEHALQLKSRPPG
ncbi:hypothetical protein SAMN05216386_2571 [Nitrosospira briensis]|uniref:Uncharacterized protein n=1 Tax=Nitrosospira briensis TaxID=35799 RepID=A0A1I5E9T3_9PROT|nr:hypothetical protein SAMN05216386_2571 [Nitrosospira briensis]